VGICFVTVYILSVYVLYSIRFVTVYVVLQYTFCYRICYVAYTFCRYTFCYSIPFVTVYVMSRIRFGSIPFVGIPFVGRRLVVVPYLFIKNRHCYHCTINSLQYSGYFICIITVIYLLKQRKIRHKDEFDLTGMTKSITFG